MRRSTGGPHLATATEGELMTYNRMEAKPMAGEHCQFCGDAKAPLVKTPCCQQWICCDTAFVSLRGGGRCQVEHERFAQFIGDCSSSKWSKHVTNSPFLARLATV